MIGKISGQYGVDALNAKKSKRGPYTGGLAASSDEANFSSFAVELARIDAELKNVPDVREDLVDKFKGQVDSGKYVPQLDKVAHVLILAGLLNVQD